mgnify:CR=1 FL=1
MISEDSFGKKSLLSVLPVGSIFGESYTCAKARNRTIAYQAEPTAGCSCWTMGGFSTPASWSAGFTTG